MTNLLCETWAHATSLGSADFTLKGWGGAPTASGTGFHGGSAHDLKVLWPIAGMTWSHLVDTVRTPMTAKVTWGHRTDANNTVNMAGSPGTLLAELIDAVGGVICSIYGDSTGTMRCYRGTSAGTLLATSSAGVMPTTGPHMWEYQITQDASAGTVDVHVDTVSIFSASGLNTNAGATFATGVVWGNANATYTQDHYVNDSNGSTCNSFAGDIRNELIMPTADGNYTDWTPGTGSAHWSLVDEITAYSYGATDFVKSSTLNAKDTYGMEDLVTASATAILTVHVWVIARKTETPTRKMAARVRSNSVDAVGFDCTLVGPINTDVGVHNSFETDPSGGGAWTITRVNAVEVGEEITV